MYEGEWEEGKPHGHGKYVHADGRVYEGEFKEGDGIRIRQFFAGYEIIFMTRVVA